MIPTLYETFQHWSEKGSVYILSDPHFNDEDCHLMSPEWISPEEQVAIINKMAHKNDTLILLGDIGDVSYVKKLKAGHKVLIMGNHDDGASKFKREIKHEIYDKDKYSFDEVKVIVSKKYPLDKVSIEDGVSVLHPPFEFYDVTIDNRLFDEVYEGPLFISEKILLSHEPILGLDFCVNIHGHDHNYRNKGDAYHLNLAANVCEYKPISLNEAIKSGLISKVKTIHRETIDRASRRPMKKKRAK